MLGGGKSRTGLVRLCPKRHRRGAVCTGAFSPVQPVPLGTRTLRDNQPTWQSPDKQTSTDGWVAWCMTPAGLQATGCRLLAAWPAYLRVRGGALWLHGCMALWPLYILYWLMGEHSHPDQPRVWNFWLRPPPSCCRGPKWPRNWLNRCSTGTSYIR